MNRGVTSGGKAWTSTLAGDHYACSSIVPSTHSTRFADKQRKFAPLAQQWPGELLPAPTVCSVQEPRWRQRHKSIPTGLSLQGGCAPAPQLDFDSSRSSLGRSHHHHQHTHRQRCGLVQAQTPCAHNPAEAEAGAVGRWPAPADGSTAVDAAHCRVP